MYGYWELSEFWVSQDVADLSSTNSLSDERPHVDGLDDSRFAWPEPDSEIVAFINSVWRDAFE